MPVDLQLERAGRDELPILANLLELYVHELSDIFALEVGADGRFGYRWLPLYASAPDDRFAYLVRVDGHLAGFALVTRGSPASEDPGALDVAEFFVLRRYRRLGIGRLAAFRLWDDLGGPWVVRVSERNLPALAFWPRTVEAYTNGVYERGTHTGASHEFLVLSFAGRRSPT